jgi:subtilisin family serine protease
MSKKYSKKFINASVVTALSVPATVVGVPVSAQETDVQQDVNTTQIIVKLADGVTPTEALNQTVADATNENVKIIENDNNLALIEVDEEKLEEVSASLENSSLVEYVEKNVTYEIAATDSKFNDFYYESQWNLKSMNVEKAWSDLDTANIPNGKSVTVAVLDTGVQHNHEDLVGRVLDGATFVDGEETTNLTAEDDQGHGTFVSGFISANANNSVGIAGVAGKQNVKILPVKVMNKNGSGQALDIAEGIRYAVDNGADVINMSISGEYSETIEEAVQYAAEKNVVVVAAAGNGGGSADASYPAALPNVISVGALAQGDQHYTRSNVGETVDLSAPGAGVFSTSMTSEKYITGSGTSYAAPHVAAVAALYKLKYPNASAAEIEEVLKATAQDLGTEGFDKETGYGKVDAAAALAGNADIASLNFTLPKANADLLGTATLSVSITDTTNVASIKFFANDNEIGEVNTPTANQTFAWDTTTVKDGEYTLKAVLYNANGEEIDAVNRPVSVYNQAKSGYMFDVKTPTGTIAKAATVSLYEKSEAEDSSYSYKEVWSGRTDADGNVRVPSYIGTDLKTLQVIVQGTFDAEEGNTWFMYNREVSTTGTVELSSENTVPVALTTKDIAKNELTGAEYFISMQDANGIELTAPKQINDGNAQVSPTVYVDPGTYDIYSHFKSNEGTYFLSSTNTKITGSQSLVFDANDAGEISVISSEQNKLVNAVLYLYNDNVSNIFGSSEVLTGQKYFVTPGEYDYIVDAEIADLHSGENWIYVFDNNENTATVKKGEKTEVQVGGSLEISKLAADHDSLRRYYKQRGFDYIDRENENIVYKSDKAFYTTQSFTDKYGNGLVGLRRGSIDSADAIYQKNVTTGETKQFGEDETKVSAIDFGNIYAKYKVVNKDNGTAILDSFAKNPTNAANRGYYWYAFWITTDSKAIPGNYEVSLTLDPTPLAPEGLSKTLDLEMKDSSVDMQVTDSQGVAKAAYITIMSPQKDAHGEYSWDTQLTSWTDSSKKLSIPTNLTLSNEKDSNVAIIRYTMPTGEYAYIYKHFTSLSELEDTIVIPDNLQKVNIKAFNGEEALTGVSTKQWLIKQAVEVDGQTIYATANNLQNYKKDAIYLAPGTYTFEGNYVSVPDKNLKRKNYYFLNTVEITDDNAADDVKFDAANLAKVNVNADTEGFTDVRGAMLYPYNEYTDTFTSTLRVGHEFYVPANLEMNLQVQLGYGDVESKDMIWNYFLSKGKQTFKENEEINWNVGGQFSAHVSLKENNFNNSAITLNGHTSIQDKFDNNITSVLVNKTSDYTISEDTETAYTLKNGEVTESKVNEEGSYTIAHNEAPAADAKSFKPVLKVYNPKDEVIFEKADLAYYTEFEDLALNNLSAGQYRVELALAASPQGPIASAKTDGLFNVAANNDNSSTTSKNEPTNPSENSKEQDTVNNGSTEEKDLENNQSQDPNKNESKDEKVTISAESIKKQDTVEINLNDIKITLVTENLTQTAHTVTVDKQNGQLKFSVTTEEGKNVTFEDYVELQFSATEFTNSNDYAFVRVLENGTYASVPFTVKDGVVTIKTKKPGTFAVTEEKNNFKDVSKYFEAQYISELSKRKIINGTSATTFEPNKVATRAHFATILARALELSPKANIEFSDVKGKWFANDVQALNEAGIVKGTGKGKFDPNATITREQAALMMMRLVDYLNVDTTTVDKGVIKFTDASKISKEATAAVQTLQKLGVFTGNPDGSFNPKGKLTRSQMSKIVYKVLELADFL